MAEDTPLRPTTEQEGISEEELSGLLGSISAMAPLLKGLLSPAEGKKVAPPPAEGNGCRRREALLLALKPYLSPERCEMVEYLIRVGRISDLLRALQ